MNLGATYRHFRGAALAASKKDLIVLSFSLEGMNLAEKQAEINAKTNVDSTMYYGIYDVSESPTVEDIETGSGALLSGTIACAANISVFKSFQLEEFGTYTVFAFFRNETDETQIYSRSVTFLDEDPPTGSMTTISTGELSFTARMANGQENAYLVYAVFSASKSGTTKTYIGQYVEIGIDDCVAKGGQGGNEILINAGASYNISLSNANADIDSNTTYYIYWYLRDVNSNTSSLSEHQVTTTADITAPDADVTLLSTSETNFNIYVNSPTEDLTVKSGLYSQNNSSLTKGGVANAVAGENNCIFKPADHFLPVGGTYNYVISNEDSPEIKGGETYYFFYYFEDLHGNTSALVALQIVMAADSTAPTGTLSEVNQIGNIDNLKYKAVNVGTETNTEDAIFKYALFNAPLAGSDSEKITDIYDALEGQGNCIKTAAEVTLEHDFVYGINLSGLQPDTTYYMYAYFKDSAGNAELKSIISTTAAALPEGNFAVTFAYEHQIDIQVSPVGTSVFYQYAIYDVYKSGMTSNGVASATLGSAGCVYKSTKVGCVPGEIQLNSLYQADYPWQEGDTYFLYGYFEDNSLNKSLVQEIDIAVSSDLVAPTVDQIGIVIDDTEMATYTIVTSEKGTAFVSIYSGTDARSYEDILPGVGAKYSHSHSVQAGVPLNHQFIASQYLDQNIEHSIQVVVMDGALNISNVYVYAFFTPSWRLLYNIYTDIDALSTKVILSPSYDGAGKLYAAIYQGDFSLGVDIDEAAVASGEPVIVNDVTFASDGHNSVNLPANNPPSLEIGDLNTNTQYYIYFYYEHLDGTTEALEKNTFVTGEGTGIVTFGISSALQAGANNILNSGSTLKWVLEGEEYIQDAVPVEHVYQGTIVSSLRGEEDFYGLQILSIGGGLTGTLDIRQWKNTINYMYLAITQCDVTSVLFPSTVTDFRFYGADCNLTGTLDLSPVTGLSYLYAHSNPNLTSVLFPTNSSLKWLNLANCNLGYINLTTLSGLLKEHDSAVILENNSLTAEEVNHILYDLDQLTDGAYTGRRIDIGGAYVGKENAAPDQTSGGYNGELAVASLIGKGITVNYNGEPILSGQVEYNEDDEFYYE